jgi:integrase
MRRKKRRAPLGYIKRGDRFYFQFTEAGKRVRDVIRNASTPEEADTEVMRRRLAIREGRDGQPDKSMLFDELLDTIFLPWSKMRKRTYYLDTRFAEVFRNAEEFKGKRVAEITPLLIERYMRRRLGEVTERGETRSPGSVNRERVALCSIFSRAVDAGLIALNPARKVKPLEYHGKRERVVTPEEEALILSKLTGRLARLRPLVIIGMYTGMRKGEMLKMRWSDVNFETRLIRIRAENAKSKKQRYVEMNSIVVETLMELREGATTNGLVFSGKGYSPNGVGDSFSKLCDELELDGVKLDDITLHCLRHSLSTRMKDNGENPFVIRDQMGHAHLYTTEEYTHSTPGTGQRAVDRLEKYAIWRSNDTEAPQNEGQSK